MGIRWRNDREDKKRKKADGKTGAVSYTVTQRLKGHSSRYPSKSGRN